MTPLAEILFIVGAVLIGKARLYGLPVVIERADSARAPEPNEMEDWPS